MVIFRSSNSLYAAGGALYERFSCSNAHVDFYICAFIAIFTFKSESGVCRGIKGFFCFVFVGLSKMKRENTYLAQSKRAEKGVKKLDARTQQIEGGASKTELPLV